MSKQSHEQTRKLETYTPNRVLNKCLELLHLETDAELVKLTGIHHATITRMRNNALPMSDRVIVRLLDATGMSIQQLRELAGQPYDGG